MAAKGLEFREAREEMQDLFMNMIIIVAKGVVVERGAWRRR